MILLLIPLFNVLLALAPLVFLEWYLFHPEKKNALGMQGVVPALKPKLAKWAVTFVEEEFLNYDFLKEKFLSNEKLSVIRKQIEEKIDDFLKNKVAEKFPFISMFLTEGTLRKIKEFLMAELDQILPQYIEKFAHGAITQIQLEKHIDEAIAKKSNAELEKIFKGFAGTSFTQLKIAAAVLALLVGFMEIFLIRLV